MGNQDFTTTIWVEQSPDKVFDAVNEVGSWRQGEVEGSTKKLNDEFTYRFGEFHYSKQKLVEFIPGKRVVWLVTDSKLSFIKDVGEWTGTKIGFKITEQNGKPQLRFAHHGLAPRIECYDACSNAWEQLIQQSLLSLITTGKGKKYFDRNISSRKNLL